MNNLDKAKIELEVKLQSLAFEYNLNLTEAFEILSHLECFLTSISELGENETVPLSAYFPEKV